MHGSASRARHTPSRQHRAQVSQRATNVIATPGHAITLTSTPAQAAAAAKGRPRVAFVVLDLTPVPHLDATAVRMLLTLVSDYRAQRLQLALSNPSERVFAMMERSGLLEVVGAPRSPTSVSHPNPHLESYPQPISKPTPGPEPNPNHNLTYRKPNAGSLILKPSILCRYRTTTISVRGFQQAACEAIFLSVIRHGNSAKRLPKMAGIRTFRP